MRINTDIYSYIDEKKLIDIIDKNEKLKNYIDQEIDRMADDGIIKKQGLGCGCPHGSGHGNGHSGGHYGCTGCGSNHTSTDAAYLTTALISIFNYYIPDEIKDAIHMGGSAFIDDSD